MQALSKLFALVSLLIMSACIYGQNVEDDLQMVLQKLDKGESVEHMQINLSDINFATGTATLAPAAKSYLDKVAKLLNSAPNMNLFIKGHTDNTGTAAVNNKLSSSRANAVRSYLILQKVAENRLEAKGFGSSLPIAENQTPEGRAKNRRVELEILKKESVKTLQDVIVLRNGEKIGVTVSHYDKEQITYRQFSTASVQQISTARVEKIVFADGREVYFGLSPDPSAAVAEKKPKSNFTFNPFAESAAFHRGQFVFGGGLGLGNNIGLRSSDNKLPFPPLWVAVELPLKYNLGVGVGAGIIKWEPKTDDQLNYTYFTISPRLAYHFNLGKQFDLYGGLAVTGRFAQLETEYEGAPVTLNNKKFDASLFAGLRYYFTNFLGIYGEYGDDNIACAKLGLALRFGR